MAMEITAMASLPTTTRASLPTPSTSPNTITTFSKPQFKRISLPTSTTISLLSLFTIPNEARAAISKDQIVSSITQVEQTIDQVQEVVSGFLDSAQLVAEAIRNVLKPGIDAGLPIVQQAGEEALKFASPAFSEASKKAQEALQSSGLDTQPVLTAAKVEKTIDQVQEVVSGFLNSAERVAEAIRNVLKPGIDAGLPIVQQAGEEALKFASPAFSEASKKAQEALQNSGLDTQPVLSAAKTVADAAQQTTQAIEGAKPIASSTIETISTSDPTVIAGTAGALFVAYLLFPPIWSAISFNFRGYKGDLTPAQTLDVLCTQNYVLIDVRSEKDKDKSGIPLLPSSAKNKMVAIPLEEVPSKIKGLVRNVKRVEAEIAALKISYLKKINKGSNIVILDSYSDSAKIVARTLTGLGFKNTWIVGDGFSGG